MRTKIHKDKLIPEEEIILKGISTCNRIYGKTVVKESLRLINELKGKEVRRKIGNISSRYIYNTKRAKGLCTDCGNETKAEKGKVRCSSCLKKHKLWCRKRSEQRKKDRKCITCGEKLSTFERTFSCISCRIKGRTWQQQKRIECRNKGICIGCFKVKPEEDYLHCNSCRKKMRERARRQKNEL